MARSHHRNLVLPLTVEPSEPRLCHDERYLICGSKTFLLTLTICRTCQGMSCPGITRRPSMRKAVTSTFISTRTSSRTFFGLQWQVFYFTFCMIPFGWKASSFLYYNLGLAVSGATRSFGVPLSRYIDDRHVGGASSHQNAEAGAYILCYVPASGGRLFCQFE